MFLYSALVFISVNCIQNLSSASDRNPQKETRIKIAELVNAINTFADDCKHFPSQKDGFKALMEKPADCNDWVSPYIKKLQQDAWGHDFIYALKKKDQFEIKSLGKDGKEGGTGLDKDISSGDDE